jgi:hypothetical protein
MPHPAEPGAAGRFGSARFPRPRTRTAVSSTSTATSLPPCPLPNSPADTSLSLVHAGTGHRESPVGPVGRIHPVAEAVNLHARLVAHRHAVRRRRYRTSTPSRAVRRRQDRLPLGRGHRFRRGGRGRLEARSSRSVAGDSQPGTGSDLATCTRPAVTRCRVEAVPFWAPAPAQAHRRPRHIHRRSRSTSPASPDFGHHHRHSAPSGWARCSTGPRAPAPETRSVESSPRVPLQRRPSPDTDASRWYQNRCARPGSCRGEGRGGGEVADPVTQTARQRKPGRREMRERIMERSGGGRAWNRIGERSNSNRDL